MPPLRFRGPSLGRGSPLSKLVGSRKAWVTSLEQMEREIGRLGPVVQDTRARLDDSLEGLGDWEGQLNADPEGFTNDLSEKVDRFRQETRNAGEGSTLLIRVDAQLPGPAGECSTRLPRLRPHAVVLCNRYGAAVYQCYGVAHPELHLERCNKPH